MIPSLKIRCTKGARKKHVSGKIISVSDLLVEVLLSGVQVKKRDMMYAVKGEKTYRFEVEDIEGNIASLVPFSNVAGLSRGTEVYKAEEELRGIF